MGENARFITTSSSMAVVFLGNGRDEFCGLPEAEISCSFGYHQEPITSHLVSLVAQDNFETLKTWINLGLDFLDKYMNSLLHLSVIFKKKDLFDSVINIVDINATNCFGQTCVYLAVDNKSEDFLVDLLKHGADVNKGNCTPLHLAVSRDYSRICEILLENDADVNALNMSGQSVLHHACKHGTMETACMLLCHGADAAIADKFGVNPLTEAMDKIPQHDFHQILFNYTFEKQAIVVNLQLLTVAMKIDSPLFGEILRRAEEVEFSRKGLITLSAIAIKIKKELFKMFMEKFPYIVENMLQFADHFYYPLIESEDGDNLASKLMDLLTMLFEFRDDFVFLKNTTCFNNFIPTIVSMYKNKKITMETLSQLTYFVYSYGMACDMDHVIAIYEHCGYCELLKFMACIDINIIYCKGQRKPLMPYLICDVKMNLDNLLDFFTAPETEYKSLLKLFASHKLHNFLLKDVEIREDLRRLPRIPSLVELARNESRKALIHKYNVKKSRDFYYVIEQLPLNDIYKKILTYEKGLYVF